MNGFLKFERKLYQFLGLPLGRPIRVKSILYFIVIGLFEIVLYFTPVLGNLINWLPFSVLLMIPIGIAWLLADIGTEDRVPLSFFKSFIQYHFRKLKRVSYVRNKEIMQEKSFIFSNYFHYKDKIVFVTEDEVIKQKEADEERIRAIRYFERITDPDMFFSSIEEDHKSLLKVKSRKTKPKNRLLKILFVRKGA